MIIYLWGFIPFSSSFPQLNRAVGSRMATNLLPVDGSNQRSPYSLGRQPKTAETFRLPQEASIKPEKLCCLYYAPRKNYRSCIFTFHRMTALLEPSRALEYLAYLGFTYQTGIACGTGPDGSCQCLPGAGLTSTPSANCSQSAAQNTQLRGCLNNAAECLLRGLTITSERRIDYIRGHTNRTVFYCRVYGSRMVGKVGYFTEFLLFLLRVPIRMVQAPHSELIHALPAADYQQSRNCEWS